MIYKTGQYDDITITVKCAVFDYGYQPDRIYKFISDAQTLSFSTEAHCVYKVKKVLAITPSYSGKGKNILSVKFQCSPFKYDAVNPVHKYFIPDGETQATIQVYNAGSIYCEPVFYLEKATVPAPATITMGSTFVTFNSTETESTFVDLQRMEVYALDDGEMVSMQDKTAGKWWDMILPPGYSQITFSGVKSLQITKNERWL